MQLRESGIYRKWMADILTDKDNYDKLTGNVYDEVLKYEPIVLGQIIDTFYMLITLLSLEFIIEVSIDIILFVKFKRFIEMFLF